ncbi:oocyte zinc finger protein XlCOF7.1-like isoform X1 [Pyxicephalus adspersus]|uniref:oocyte zinc finger protein XlCOF7.1-like isoform X1 n=1 Tax=Pyxicephalus adspersus TaxID=30357 RepID=UPI003B5AAD86
MKGTQRSLSDTLLDLTLEIIFLLTGEECIVMTKASGEILTASINVPVQYPSLNATEPDRNNKKVLEVLQKMIGLLTGEVPIRCQDGTVYFSMEEWEYLEGHKDLYKDVMMEDHQTLTSPDSPSANCQHDGSIIVPNPPTDQSSSPEEQNTARTLENITKASNFCEEEDNFPQCNVSTTTQHTLTTSTCVKEELLPAEEHFPHVVDSTSTQTMSGTGDCKVEIVISEEQLQPDFPTLTQHTQYSSSYYKEDPFLCEEHHTRNEFSSIIHFTTTHDQGENVPDFDTSCFMDHNKNTPEPCSFNKSLACFKCNKCFRVRSELMAHQRSHDGQKSYCFSSSAGLASQQIHHTDTTSYSCSDCGKFFTTYSNLSLHQKIHLGVKPYSCPECGKCFLRNSHLTRHRQSHVGDRVRPYSCTECGKSFLTRSAFLVHWRNHTGENPYSCLECGKSFSAYSCLMQHWRVHTGEKPYPCSECGKCFAAHSNLTLHHRTHTGEKPYCCPECGKRFVRNSHLRRHRQCHTGEEPHLCAE